MRRREERGSFTLWTIGLCVLLLMIGGVSLDLWRAFAARRSLAAMADAAAVAGASALDEAAFRRDGSVVLELDPGADLPSAVERAAANLEAQADYDEIAGDPQIDADPNGIRVSLAGEVDFTLVRLFAGGGAFTVSVTATAQPRQSA